MWVVVVAVLQTWMVVRVRTGTQGKRTRRPRATCASDARDKRMAQVQESQVRPISGKDLSEAAARCRPSVNMQLLSGLVAWNNKYGSYHYALPPALLLPPPRGL